MLAPWVVAEMKNAKLKDERLNRRLQQLLSDLGDRPTASIPAACGGFNETVAAYRFFDNEKVTPEKILQPHYARTLERIAAQKRVLLVQDTTELDFTRPKQQVTGAGPLTGNRLGAYLHPLVAFDTEGTPLGTVQATIWMREETASDDTAAAKRERLRATPIEDKESMRWVEGVQTSREIAQNLPDTQCICIADSEADIYEVFSEPRGDVPVHWVIRACQNRTLQRSADTDHRSVLEAVRATRVLYTKEINVRGREAQVKCNKRQRNQPRDNRKTEVAIRATTLTLRAPSRPDRQLPDVVVNMVLVEEINPPKDDVAVEWLLVTTLPITTVDEVCEIIKFYTIRFMIEVFFRVLKSGCRVEERLFEHIDRLLPCVALYLIVAWRTLMVCRLGRGCPDMNCEAVFEPSEWKSVWMVIHKKKPPKKPPTLAVMLKLVAQLGGYVNYPNRDDPPGPQTIWIGLQRTRDLAWAWDTFGPGAAAPT